VLATNCSLWTVSRLIIRASVLQRSQRKAVIYIRQSSPKQVREHLDSQLTQRTLVHRAEHLGWHPERIEVFDGDLGQSAAGSQERDDFQALGAAVALGHGGMVFGWQVSRLARNNAEWYQLLDLAALLGTLIGDTDGIYDPRLYNDRLLLGLKGTMSEAELHFLKARMRGGMLNKARRGELEMRPPVGLVYREDGVLSLDPDTEVQAALRMVFKTFERTGSAMQIVKLFNEQGLRFPRRIRKGVNKGELHWVKAAHSRML